MLGSSLTPVAQIWFTLSNILTCFASKMTKSMVFKKMPEIRIKQDKMLKDWLFLYYLMTFEKFNFEIV
jgi:hypothetical protein